MSNRVWIPFFAFMLAAIQPAISAERDARMIAEAKAIMRILRAEAPDPERCLLSENWSQQKLPEEIGRKYFGLTVHADMSPPFTEANPSEVLDLRPENAFAFCTHEEDYANQDSKIKEFMANDEKYMGIRSWDFTFPIFDSDMKTAAVITSNSASTWYKNDTGVHQGPESFVVSANIFRKSKGEWHKVQQIGLGHTL